jgi:hypothetical protein
MPWRHETQLIRGKPTYWNGRTIIIATVSAMMAAGLVYYLLQTLPARELQRWPTSVGVVTAAHTIVRQLYNGERGSAGQFQPEIRVTYIAAGVSYTRWFPLPGRWDLTRGQMDAKAAELVGTQCQVHWRARKPLDAYVTEMGTASATKQSAR